MVRGPHMFPTLLGAGVLLAVATVAGRVASWARLPHITGYLLAGFAAGPGVFGLASPAVTEPLDFVYQLALALVLFEIGSHFDLARLRKHRRRVVGLAIADIGVTLILVGVGTLAFGASLQVAILLGILAIATAPAATLLVLKEYKSEGPVTDTMLTLLALNNVATIVLFAAAVTLMPASPQGAAVELRALAHTLGRLVAAPAVGVGIGLGLCYLEMRITDELDHVLLTLAAVALTIGAAGRMGLSPLLAALALGAVIANVSASGRRLVVNVESFFVPVYLVFFVLAGSHLRLTHLVSAGSLALGYLAARCVAKIFAPRLGGRLVRQAVAEDRWMGVGLLCQAGVVLGLAFGLANQRPDLAATITPVLLLAVFVLELSGPPLVKLAVVRGGEVKVAQLLTHRRAAASAFDNALELAGRLRRAVGLPTFARRGGGRTPVARDLMRRAVESIAADARFHDVLHQIEGSRYDRFPVTDAAGDLVGLIDFADVRDLIFDERLDELVRAIDLARPARHTVAPTASLEEALREFAASGVTFLPVVDPAEPRRLLGMLAQRDVVGHYRHEAKEGQSS